MRIVSSHEVPESTTDNPFASIEWLFDTREAMFVKESSASNIRVAKKHFLDFVRLEYRDIKPHDLMEALFDEYVHVRFSRYVDDLVVSSSHKVGIVSSVRVVFSFGIENDLLPVDHLVWGRASLQASRETDAYRPYTPSEMKIIEEELTEALAICQRVAQPYQRVTNPEEDRKSHYLNSEDNMLWYFENVLNCSPITGGIGAPKDHAGFLASATNQHGGLHNMYRRWGVTALVDESLISPLVYRLTQITGLNPESVINLGVDAFVESHPLTLQPYLQFFKTRSTGSKELHLGLLVPSVVRLERDQVSKVKEVIELVLKLTEGIRASASDDIKGHLFIYESTAPWRRGGARKIKSGVLTNWAQKVSNNILLKHNIELKLKLTRFRPSLVSSLLRQDVDVDVIKSILGHRSVLTTLNYIDSHDFSPVARTAVKKALVDIYSNAKAFSNAPEIIATSKETPGVYRTALGLCKNVYSPPNNIRKGAGIEIGQACTKFNMCLKCANVIITRESLPDLAALKTSYEIALTSGVESSTHRYAARQSLSILSNILDPEVSEFSAEDIEWAKRESLTRNPYVDPVAYRAVLS